MLPCPNVQADVYKIGHTVVPREKKFEKGVTHAGGFELEHTAMHGRGITLISRNLKR